MNSKSNYITTDVSYYLRCSTYEYQGNKLFYQIFFHNSITSVRLQIQNQITLLFKLLFVSEIM